MTYNNEFTLSFQFKLDDNSGTGYQYMYSHGAFGTSNSLNVLIGESGQGGIDANQLIVRFVDTNDPTGIMDLNYDVTSITGDGQWHTFTLVAESGVGSTVYIDGVFNKTHSNGGDAFNPSGDVYLGAREDLNASRFFGGQLDSVQIHDNALNAADVSNLHTRTNQIATVNITVDAVNDAPLATNLNAAESYTEDTALDLTDIVVALDLTDIVVSDVDSANVTVTLTLSDVTAGSLNTATAGTVTSTFVAGVWTASGAIADVNTLLAGVTFTPALNYNSNFSIATSVDDGVAAAIIGSKAMTATPVNDAPLANSDNFTVNEGSTTILDLAGNDVDADDGLDLNSIVIIGAPANGSLTINGDGTVTYTHDGSETLSDSFSYTIADFTGAISNTAMANLTITPQNDAPIAVTDASTLNVGGSVNIDLASNDIDVDNALDLNSVVITASPVNGTLTVYGDGTVDYSHDGSATVSDSFSYTIADISGAISNVINVTITINPVNAAPTTSGIANVTVNEDSGNSNIDLHAAFDDVDNLDSELTYSIVGNTNVGLFSSAAVNAVTGELILDYAADMNGSRLFRILCQRKNTRSIRSQIECSIKPAFKEDGQLR